MLEALLVPLVTSAAARAAKALASEDAAGDAGALAGALVRAMLSRGDETTKTLQAIADVAVKVDDVRRTQWLGPYNSAMDSLEKAGRPALTDTDRAEQLKDARRWLAAAKGAAPQDPRIAAALDVAYALVWIAEGQVPQGKDQLIRTSAHLEHAILDAHVAAAGEVPVWLEHDPWAFGGDWVPFAVSYSVRSLFPKPSPPDPFAPGRGSYQRLIHLTADHERLRRLRTSLHTAGDPFPVTVAAPRRRLYDAGIAAVVVEQPRHVTAACFGVTTTASLAPSGRNRKVTFAVRNGRAEAVNVCAFVTSDPSVLRWGQAPLTLPSAGVHSSDQSAPLVLGDSDVFVIGIEVPTAAGRARIFVPFPPEPEGSLALSFQDRRALLGGTSP